MQMNISPLLLGVLMAVPIILIPLLISWKFNISKEGLEKAKQSVADERSKTAKTIGIILFIMGGLPLLVYPFVIMANAMSLAGFEFINGNPILKIYVLLFVLASSTYPLTYITCLIFYSRRGIRKNMIPIIPLLHIFVVVLLGYIWGIVGKLVEY